MKKDEVELLQDILDRIKSVRNKIKDKEILKDINIIKIRCEILKWLHKNKKIIKQKNKQYEKTLKEFFRERKKKRLNYNRLNKLFVEKLERTSSEICFLYKYIMKNIFQKKISFNINLFKKNNSFYRNTPDYWVSWLIRMNLIIKIRRQQYEFIITDKLKKLLKENAKRIIERCDKLENS